MYSRFIFGDFKGKDMKGKELQKFGAFVDSFPSKSTELSESAWLSKLRINQALLKSKQEHDSSNVKSQNYLKQYCDVSKSCKRKMNPYNSFL